MTADSFTRRGSRRIVAAILGLWIGSALLVGAVNPAPLIQDPAPQAATADRHAAWRERLVDDGRAVVLEDRSGNDCLRCHQGIGEEWAHSTHATAWQDQHYQKALKKIRRKQGCWGCHAPEPLAAAGWPQSPKVRADDRHLGVTCTTCHLAADGETMLGPAGHTTDAHPSQADVRFDESQSNELCIACHATTIGPVIGIAKDFVSSDQEGLGSSCVDCHMGRVTRAWAEPWEDGMEPLPERRGRSHRIKTPRDPEFLASAFLLEARSTETGAELVLANQTGHRVPGLIDRKIVFEVQLLDAEGSVLASAERTFDTRAFLPVEEEVTVALTTSESGRGQGVKVRARGTHSPPGAKQPQVFLDRSYALTE